MASFNGIANQSIPLMASLRRRLRLFSALSAAVPRAWRWFLPPARSPKQDEEAQRVLIFCLGMAVWVPISALAYHLLGVTVAVDILLIAALPLAMIVFILRRGLHPGVCGNLLVALTLVIYTALAQATGGPSAPVTPWFVSLPIIAVFVTGARWGTFWAFVALLTVSGFFVAAEMGSVFSMPFPASSLRTLQCAALARLVVFIAVLALIFKWVEGRQRTALKDALLAAQGADRAKSEFLANMSHEIRTPLTAILGYTDLLRENCSPSGQAMSISQGDALETIHRNGEHLLQVINDILDLSKIEAGRLDVDWCFASPRQIVADVITLFEARAAAKDLRLESRCDAEVPHAIETDPTRLRQVLVNIVGNAIKFTEIGSVRIDAKWIIAGTGAGRIEFAIRDSGIGMTPHEINRLFRPFTQADGSTTRRFGGTGLGLAICRRLVEMMGGTIQVTSEPGQGSCFTVSLPIVRTRFHSTKDKLAEGKDRRLLEGPASRIADEESLVGYRILLADDSTDNQRLIRHLLQAAGAEVALVDNGQSAVDLALEELGQGSAFDLVLMDMQMPILDGYEATSRLRAAGYRQPIVALTAHALRTDHDKCRASGCDDVCTKPIDRAGFFAAIRRQLGRTESEPIVELTSSLKLRNAENVRNPRELAEYDGQPECFPSVG